MIHDVYNFQFVAGNLSVDFVNTVAFRADPAKQKDHLQRAADVYRWATQAQLPELAAINSGPRIGPSALRYIRAVREQLFVVLHAVASGNRIQENAIVRVGNALHECRAKRRLSVEGAEVRWEWRASARAADYLLLPVLTAATDLLTSDLRGLVRQCEAEDCGWLFLDRSNARKRRWCSMSDCGNRNKARNFYRREAGLI